MLPNSHPSLMPELPTGSLPAETGLAVEHQLLTQAFSEFISASGKLELSYRELQAEVRRLSDELMVRNTELRRSRTENRSMRLGVQQTLHALPCGVVVLKDDGAVTLINPEAERLLDLPGIDGGSAVAGLAPELGSLLLRTAELEGGNGKEASSEWEFSLMREEGERWVAVRRRTLSDGTGGDRRTLLILRDISAEKRSSLEREAARDSVALAQLGAVLAHEIRNPLAALELFAGLVAEVPERSAEWSADLQAGIRSLSGITNNVLTLHNGAPLEVEPVDLPEALARALEFARPLAKQSGLTLELIAPMESATDDNAMPSVWLNRSALQQIVLNLTGNAVRHARATRLEVRIGREGAGKMARTTVLVSDNGCGMEQQVADRAFEKGFSGPGGTLGLGLAVCRQLMEQQGGSVTIRSRPGAGTAFRLEFPVR